MKTLKISSQITNYYDDFDRDTNQYYLDTKTGETIVFESFLQNRWEDGGEIVKEDLPQWQQDEYDTIMAVLNDVDRNRYHEIPSVDVGESSDIMREFARTVQNEKIADELFAALQGSKAFRRFRAVLNRYDKIRHAYSDYKEKCYLVSLEEWLHEIGIEPEWIN